MAWLFASGHVADLLILLTALEWAGVAAYRFWSGRGVPALDLLSLLLPGVFLILSLRFALTGGAWPMIAACLLASLIAHLHELRRRWR